MVRLARAVVCGIPYHVTHRGNRRQDVFLSDSDRVTYCRWLQEYGAEFGLDIWAYCLMSNHIHLLVVPQQTDSLAKAVGRTHMRHARRINGTGGWTGHLWEHRFYSTPLDEAHLWTAVKYIERNPVRAGLVEQGEQWPWSSARAHALGEADALLSPNRPFPKRGLAPAAFCSVPVPFLETDAPPLALVDWSLWLAQTPDAEAEARLRLRTRTGRPCGDPSFVERIGQLLGRMLHPLKRGRKPKAERLGNDND